MFHAHIEFMEVMIRYRWYAQNSENPLLRAMDVNRQEFHSLHMAEEGDDVIKLVEISSKEIW